MRFRQTKSSDGLTECGVDHQLAVEKGYLCLTKCRALRGGCVQGPGGTMIHGLTSQTEEP